MSTDAEELAKTILGIKLRHILMVVVACCAFLGSVAAGLAAYEKLGWPVPASREFVTRQVEPVSNQVDDLSVFARQTRKLILSDKWWRLQEKIEEVGEAQSTVPQNGMLRDQARRLRRDQQAVQQQIDMLEVQVR